MIDKAKKQRVKTEIKAELNKWEMHIDLVKVQMLIGSKVPEVPLKHFSKELEKKFRRANEQYKNLEEVNGEKLEEIHGDIKQSINTMEEIFHQVKKYY